MEKPTMNPKLLIAGFFGVGNIGDEAILSATITNLESYCDIDVLSYQSFFYYTPKRILKLFRKIASADALVLGGGGFLANELQPTSIYYWLSLIFIAKLLRKKVILFAAGCGPFKKGKSLIPIRLILNKLDTLLLRDSVSQLYMKQIGIDNPTKVTADIAFLLEPAVDANLSNLLKQLIVNSHSPRVLFILPLRFHLKSIWKPKRYREKYLRYISSISKIADFVVEQLNGTPIFFPFAPQDIQLYREIISLMKMKRQAVIYNDINYRNIDFDSILSFFQKVDLVVGGRYHSIIFSILSGVPVLPVIYHPKFCNLVNKLNMTDMSLEVGDGIEWHDVDIDLEKATQNLIKIYRDKEKYKTLALKLKEEMKKKAMINISSLRDIFEV
jgi:polysaccharide pyruvyl transferase CsaB